jgi:hypothetical protein
MATGKMEEAEQMDESPMRPSVKWAADTKAGASSFCQITGLPSCQQKRYFACQRSKRKSR